MSELSEYWAPEQCPQCGESKGRYADLCRSCAHKNTVTNKIIGATEPTGEEIARLERPRALAYPAHGSGFIAYYDCKDVDAYIDQLEQYRSWDRIHELERSLHQARAEWHEEKKRALEAEAEKAQLERQCDHLLLQAQCQAQEMRTHKSTVHEIYQVLTGATGEPGNWNGAEPARKVMAQIAQAETKTWNEAIEAAVAEILPEVDPQLDDMAQSIKRMILALKRPTPRSITPVN